MKWEYDAHLMKKLDQDLKEYDRIFLFSNDVLRGQNLWIPGKMPDQKPVEKILAEFCSFIRSQNRRNVLVLSAAKLQDNWEGLPVYRRITEKEADDLSRLYHMYEFSDRFFLVCRERSYAYLFDFMNAGLLRLEEVFAALVQI